MCVCFKCNWWWTMEIYERDAMHSDDSSSIALQYLCMFQHGRCYSSVQLSSCAEVPCRRCRVCWFCCVRRICYFGFGRRILSSATRDAETFLLSRICERVCEKQDGDEFSAPPTTTCEVASIHDCRFIADRQSMLASSNLPAAKALVTTEVR